MTTATRSHAQNRNVLMFPAYTLAFVLPVVTITFAYIAMDGYCSTATNEIIAPRMCVGLSQIKANTLTVNTAQ
jgi:hypothetical protein